MDTHNTISLPSPLIVIANCIPTTASPPKRKKKRKGKGFSMQVLILLTPLTKLSPLSLSTSVHPKNKLSQLWTTSLFILIVTIIFTNKSKRDIQLWNIMEDFMTLLSSKTDCLEKLEKDE